MVHDAMMTCMMYPMYDQVCSCVCSFLGHCTCCSATGDLDVLASSSHGVAWYENGGGFVPVWIPHVIAVLGDGPDDFIAGAVPIDVRGCPHVSSVHRHAQRLPCTTHRLTCVRPVYVCRSELQLDDDSDAEVVVAGIPLVLYKNTQCRPGTFSLDGSEPCMYVHRS